MKFALFSRLTRLIQKYPILFIVALGVLWGLGYFLVPIDFHRNILAPSGEGDRVYFGDKTVVAQEFIPHSGLKEVTVSIGSSTDVSTPLVLHIKKSLDGPDLIAKPAFTFQDEKATFAFSPLWSVPEKLLWVLEAPHASSKSFWVYREQDAQAYTEGLAYVNSRALKGNLAFSEVWAGSRLFNKNSDIGRYFGGLASWEYQSIWIGIIAMFGYLLLRKFSVSEKVLIFIFIVFGVMLHIWLSVSTPLIIDEGAYIQDVLQTSSQLMPFRDFLTKGPLYLGLLWLWSFIVPHAVATWRLFPALSWALGAWCFWGLLKEFNIGQKARVLSVFAFTLIPASVALTTPLLLGSTSIAVSIFGLLLAIRAAKRASWQLVVSAALVFTAGFLIRITSALPAIIGVLALLLYASKKERFRLALIYIGTGISVFVVTFLLLIAAIGLPKAAVTMNMEAFLISQNRQDISEARDAQDEPIIRSLTIESRVLWRSGALLIIPIFIVPIMYINPRKVLSIFSILFVLFLINREVLLHLYDTNFLLPKGFTSTTFFIAYLVIGLPLMTAMATILYAKESVAKEYLPSWKVPFLTLLWLGITTVAYAHWGRFRQSYLTEFIPQLALLFGVGYQFLFDAWGKIKPKWMSWALRAFTVFVGGALIYQGYAMALIYPHTGTVSQESLVDIVRLIQKNVPRNEAIFTAQPVATSFSHRSIIFGYSHPGWYREARFHTISEQLRDLLFVKPEVLTEYLRTNVNFVLMETRTNEIYFDGYPERRDILNTDFEKIGSVDNSEAGDTYTLYRRK